MADKPRIAQYATLTPEKRAADRKLVEEWRDESEDDETLDAYLERKALTERRRQRVKEQQT